MQELGDEFPDPGLLFMADQHLDDPHLQHHQHPDQLLQLHPFTADEFASIATSPSVQHHEPITHFAPLGSPTHSSTELPTFDAVLLDRSRAESSGSHASHPAALRQISGAFASQPADDPLLHVERAILQQQQQSFAQQQQQHHHHEDDALGFDLVGASSVILGDDHAHASHALIDMPPSKATSVLDAPPTYSASIGSSASASVSVSSASYPTATAQTSTGVASSSSSNSSASLSLPTSVSVSSSSSSYGANTVTASSSSSLPSASTSASFHASPLHSYDMSSVTPSTDPWDLEAPSKPIAAMHKGIMVIGGFRKLGPASDVRIVDPHGSRGIKTIISSWIKLPMLPRWGQRDVYGHQIEGTDGCSAIPLVRRTASGQRRSYVALIGGRQWLNTFEYMRGVAHAVVHVYSLHTSRWLRFLMPTPHQTLASCRAGWAEDQIVLLGIQKGGISGTPPTLFGVDTKDWSVRPLASDGVCNLPADSGGRHANEIQLLSELTDKPLPAVPPPHAMLSHERKLYVIGRPHIDVFDVDSSTWSRIAMPDPSAGQLGAAILYPYLYVCGIASDCEKLFRRYNLETELWEQLDDYPEQPRVTPPLLAYYGRIYLLPSLLECRTRVVSSVHVFDPNTERWAMTVVRELRPHIFAYGFAAIESDG